MEPRDPLLFDTFENVGENAVEDASEKTLDDAEALAAVQLPVRYELEKLLGHGGMGTVVKAKDLQLNRTVAIKMLRRDVASTEKVRLRLEREAKILAGFAHPNIAALHGIEEHEGRLYLVMAFCEGETLQDAMDRGALTDAQKIDALRQLASALEYAHAAGVVHRDIKPSNLMLSPDGRLQLLDFGLARRDAESTLTTQGATLGTIFWMAPEQLQGKRVTAATDLWAVGVVAYELFEGKLPFGGKDYFDIGLSVIKDPHRPQEKTEPRVRAIIERLLQKSTSDRYGTATELRLALDEVAGVEPQRRRATVPMWQLVAAATVAIGAVLAYWLTSR